MTNETSLLSVRQFAAKLNVTEACVRRWLLLRRITSVKIGRLVRIPAEEVEQLINSGFRPVDPRFGLVPPALQPLFDEVMRKRDLRNRADSETRHAANESGAAPNE